MMKNKMFLVFYDILFVVITFLLLGYIFWNHFDFYGNDIYYLTPFHFFLYLITLVLFVVFQILLLIHKNFVAEVIDLILEGCLFVFLIFLLICCYFFDQKLLIPGFEYSYYSTFLLIAYIGFELYSMLLFDKKKKKTYLILKL